MLSICFPTRKKGNPSWKLKDFLDSLEDNTTRDEKKLVEVILKFDHDDDDPPDFVVNNKYSFEIKTTRFARGNGRRDMHIATSYLISLRNPLTKFVMASSDDMVFTRPFVKQILSYGDYSIIGGGVHPTSFSKATLLSPDYRAWNSWDSHIGAYCPIWHVKILEAISNNLIMCFYDWHTFALVVALNLIYKVNIGKDIESFYDRNEIPGKEKEVKIFHEDAGPNYNLLEVPYHQGGHHPNYWTLLESQVRNIYLNMKYDNII